MKAGDVFVGIAQLQLLDDVVPHALRGAGGERGDGAVGKIGPQAAQLAIFGTKLVTPLRNAVRFVNGEKAKSACSAANRACPRAPAAPAKDTAGGIRPRALCASLEPARRPSSELFNSAAGMPICVELRNLVLHQRDQRRNDDDGLPRQHRAGQLVAKRFPAAGGHHHASVAPPEQALHDALLQGTEGLVSPVAAQGRQEVWFRIHASSIEVRE